MKKTGSGPASHHARFGYDAQGRYSAKISRGNRIELDILIFNPLNLT